MKRMSHRILPADWVHSPAGSMLSVCRRWSIPVRATRLSNGIHFMSKLPARSAGARAVRPVFARGAA
ncbi:MAG: hypothetical protein D6725_04765 [Planctomycetota bacterium]|nr:MAG: hypothetical protein D6725_04765 [Planctomycetota bacterium]